MFSNRSLATRLTIWYSASAFVLLLAASSYLYWALLVNLDVEDDESLRDQQTRIHALLDESPFDLAALRREVESVTAPDRLSALRVRVFDGDGAILAESPGMPEFGFESPAAGREVETADGRSYRVVGSRAGPFLIQVALDRTREEAMLKGFLRNLWAVLAAAVLLCAFGGYQIASRCIRPIHDVIDKARKIGAATLNQRIGSAGQASEIAALAVTFNAMLDRLQESFARLSRFSADIAHELRTPVNNMRGEMEVGLGKARSPEEYRETIGSALEECQRLSRIIDSLLFLARAENPETQIRRESLNVGQELRTVAEFYEAAASEAGVALTVEAPPTVVARLDRTLFQRAISNLVANAISYTPAAGRVTVSAVHDGDGLRVEVADTGCGIQAAHLPRVFDRLYRVDGARSATSGGVGLGLAIVKSVAHLHGGSVRIESEENRGTRVTMVMRDN
jgi:two-component system heavy metal sensor histidine kinase CusS